MKKHILTSAIVAALSCTTSVNAGSIELPTLNVGTEKAASQLHEEQKKRMVELLKSRSLKSKGISPLNDGEVDVIDVAVYLHPVYVAQSYITTKSISSGQAENGGSFAMNRVKSFFNDINTNLEQSGVNAKVNLTFVGMAGNGFPILSNTGSSEYVMPDGVTKVTTDAEFFELYMQDWGDDATRYGIPSVSGTRKMKMATGADLHVYMRPHYDERFINDGFAAPSLDTFVGLRRPLIDSGLGSSYEFGTMTIYDYYWHLGYQGFNPNSPYVLKTATHHLGRVLQAGQEEGKIASPFSYGKAYTCGGANTVMHSLVSSTVLPFFSSPTIFNNGEACGVEKGLAGEADNRSVIQLNAPLLASYSVPKNPNSSFSISNISPVYSDGEFATVLITRSGDLSETAYLTLSSEESSATEGYINPTTREASEGADYIFGVRTVEFAPGQATSGVNFEIPVRKTNNLYEQFFIHATYAANATIDPDKSTIRFGIRQNFQPERNIVEFELSDISANENTLAVLPVVSSEITDGDVVVNVKAIDGNAIQGINYELLTETLTFNAQSEQSQNVEVRVLSDGKYEKNMFFDVEISSENADISNKIVRVYINEISQPDIGTVVAERESLIIDNQFAEFNINLIRENNSDEQHTVSLRTGQSSTLLEGEDYELPDSVTFEHRETNKTVTVKMLSQKLGNINLDVYSDSLSETLDSTNITVEKSANLPSVLISETVSATETAVSAIVMINRTVADTRVVLDIDYVNDTALAGVDFKDEQKTLTLEIGELSSTLNIPLIDRTDTNGDRNFTVAFSSDTVTLPVSTASVTITDVIRNDGGSDGGDSGDGADSDNGKIDNYAGANGLWSLLLLPLAFLRRRKKF